jgi:UDP-glucose 4-epimerase
MKCLITGAGGFIGSALAHTLAAEGAELLLASRHSPVAISNVQTLFLDFVSASLSPAQMEGVETVFHCAGIAHMTASPAEYEWVNFDATLALAALAAAAGVKRFIFFSSIKAAESAGPYGYWKWRAEQSLEAQYADSAMAVVIVRPSLVYGPGVKGNLPMLIQAISRGLPAPPEGEPRSMVALADLCQAMVLVTRSETSGVRRYTVSDDQPYTLGRLYRAIRAGLGRPPARRWLPTWTWRLGCLCLDLLRRQRRGETSYEKLFGSSSHSDPAFARDFGWQPARQFEDELPAMLEQLRAH